MHCYAQVGWSTALLHTCMCRTDNHTAAVSGSVGHVNMTSPCRSQQSSLHKMNLARAHRNRLSCRRKMQTSSVRQGAWLRMIGAQLRCGSSATPHTRSKVNRWPQKSGPQQVTIDCRCDRTAHMGRSRSGAYVCNGECLHECSDIGQGENDEPCS